MHIGLDYYDTITLDPELWDRVIALFIDAGHQVTIVTIRSDRHGADDIKNYADAHGIPAVFTFGCQKDTFTAALGITIDIWIDDTPLLIPDCKEMPGLVLGEYRSKQCFIDNEQTIETYKRGDHDYHGRSFPLRAKILQWLVGLTRWVAGYRSSSD